MRKTALFVYAAVIISSSLLTFARSNQPPAKYVPGQLLVKFRAGTRPAAIRAAHLALQADVISTFGSAPALHLIRLPAAARLSAALATYRSNPDVEYAEPNYIVHSSQTPTDPLFSTMWALQNTGQAGGTLGADIKATQAWNITTGSSNVIVAVIDTGVDYNHPDLAANIFNGAICPAGVICHGINAITGATNPNDPFDDNGHGTHVSGTIGAVGNNSVGVAGVNWNVTILPCKFLGSDGSGAVSDAIKCLDFIKSLKDTQGLNIVASNNSWGSHDFSQALQDAIDRQRQSGILFIAAAGNDFANNDILPTYPASFPLPNIISVAATDRNDHRSFFSNVGRHTVHIGAPGQDILSTLPGATYGVDSGTSMATPHVTGVAALLAAQAPTRDWRAIKNLILAGGDTNSDLAATITGRRLDAFGSLTCANSTVAGRLAPATEVVSASVGTPVPLSVLNINCAQPAGGVQVTVSPGGQTIALADDGISPDLSAGDGVYSSAFTPNATGVYTLTFSTGDVLTVQVLDNYQVTDNSSAFSYRTIVGTNLNLGDDDVAQITSPFPIAFGNGSFTNLWVSANGTLSFSGAFSTYVHEFIPTANSFSHATIQATTLVAPFWDDLLPVPGSAQNVFWDVTGTAPNRELVVEWRDVRAFDCVAEPDSVRFEAVFFENSSDVLFNYADAVFGGSCVTHDRGSLGSVGIQTAPQLGTSWGFEGQVVNDRMALLWQTSNAQPPAPLDPSITSLSPGAVEAYGPDFILTINGANFQPGARVSFNGVFDRVTTFVSNTQLQVLIPSSDLNFFELITNTVQFGVRNPGGPGVTNQVWPQLTINNPAHPVITGFNPPTAPGNGLSFFLDILGDNLTPHTTILWNGQSLSSVPFGSKNHVQVIVPGSVAVPGTATVQVVNPAPGGGASPAASFLLGPSGPAILFNGSAFVLTHPQPGQISPTVAQGSSRPVQFLGWQLSQKFGPDYLNHFLRPYAPAFTASASGQSFGSPAIPVVSPAALPGILVNGGTPTGFLPTSIAVGDFNRDGHPDYVVANGGSNDLWLYPGNGDGTFQNPRIIPLRGLAPLQVIAADLRGIGILDLILVESDSLSIGVLLGNGDGTFGDETLYFSPAPPLSIAVADFNGDGHLDVVAGVFGDNRVGALVLFAGDGTGRLAAPLFSSTTTVDETPFVVTQMSVTDVDKDGFPDLVVTDFGSLSPGVILWRNQHDGTFKAKPALLSSDPDVGFFYLNTAAGDLNHDGCPDIVANDDLGLTTVLLGNCDSTFHPGPTPARYGSGDVAANTLLADLNGDGNLDLINTAALLNGSTPGGQSGELVSVSFGDGSGAFAPPRVVRVQTNIFGLALADFNGDLHPDLVVASQEADSVTVLLNDGLGHLPGPQGEYIGYAKAGAQFVGPVNSPDASYIADVNGDGKPDLVFINSAQGFGLPPTVSVALNDGTGGFKNDIKSPVLDGQFFFGDLVLGDFRKTGHMDLVVVSDQRGFGPPGNFYNFLAGAGDGHFGLPIQHPLTHPAGTLAAGDFNGDGKLDFLFFAFSGISVFLGNGDGTFNELPQIPLNIALPLQVFVADVNGDGKLDLLVPLIGSLNGLVEFLGRGDGTFAPGVVVAPSVGDFEVADLNHDGRADVVLRTASPTAPNSPLFQVYLGQPDGTLVLSASYSPYAGAAMSPVNGQLQFSSSFLGDFNGDGNLDIAAFQSDPRSGNYAQILIGNGDGTFTPTFEKLPFGVHNRMLPTRIADFSGDGKADLAELDAFTSAFNVVNSTTGQPFTLHFVSLPVIGSSGRIRVDLAAPAAADTLLSISASDPAISIASSINIPSGTLSGELPFTLDPAFDLTRTFTVSATDGLHSSSALASATHPGAALGILLLLNKPPFSALAPGESTLDLGFGIASRGSYQTTVSLGCTGPAGITCRFGSNSADVAPGLATSVPLVIDVSPTVATGNYVVTITATDPALSQTLPVSISVGDFSLNVFATSGAALPTGAAVFRVELPSINNLGASITITCTGLPSAAACPIGSPLPANGAEDLTITSTNLAVGDYPFTLTASAGALTHSVSSVLHVGDFGASAITPTTATLTVSQSAVFNLSVSSVNGFSDPVNFFCTPSVNGVPVQGIVCTFSPSPATFDSTGKLTAQVTVLVSARPRGAAVQGRASFSPPLYPLIAILFGLATVTVISPRRRRAASIISCLGMLVLLSAVACGGGGSGAGGTSSPATPTPTPAPQTVSIDVFGGSQRQSQAQPKKLATFSITVQ